MSDTPSYRTSHPDCVEEVDHLAHVLAEMVALAGDLADDRLTGDQAWHRLGVLVDLSLARPRVQEARRLGGAR